MHSLLDAIICSYISLEAGWSYQSAMAAKEENEGNWGEKEEDAEERELKEGGDEVSSDEVGHVLDIQF